MKRRTVAKKIAEPVLLAWFHQNRPHRVTVWPDVRFEQEIDGRWLSVEPDPTDAAFGNAQEALCPVTWTRYLGFVPEAERALLRQFRAGRLAALAVITRCPGLLADLQATPALAPFLAAHTELRGTETPRWSEINAVHERGGIFAVLEWLGLPATREALDILSRIEEPDLARFRLEPIRASLWEPEYAWLLRRVPVVGEREIARCCPPLAA